ncbi:hypothetical protein ElyMa_006453600 [Elysia marginata]|uniref:Uncharacterized protein n=1 Tax=Elysia marginata TaxID=1093978 RepID=A0AAV4HYF7_9GAST|nr:hypothetical protein ElyMa_006453600 [Elysia marginata]
MSGAVSTRTPPGPSRPGVYKTLSFPFPCPSMYRFHHQLKCEDKGVMGENQLQLPSKRSLLTCLLFYSETVLRWLVLFTSRIKLSAAKAIERLTRLSKKIETEHLQEAQIQTTLVCNIKLSMINTSESKIEMA